MVRNLADPRENRPFVGTQMKSEQRPDILFVSIDTMRRDAMAPYGWDLLPEATRLLEEGVAFDRCFAAAPWTGASFGSMLTGLWPRQHGCRSNNPRLHEPNSLSPLREDVPLLQESLRDAGYHTMCSQANVGYLSPAGGFMRGFVDHNHRHLETGLSKMVRAGRILSQFGPGKLVAEVWHRARKRLGLAGLPRPSPLMRGEAILGSALKMLGRAPHDTPAMLWVNFMDMHDPYWAPRRWMPPGEAPGKVRPVHLRPHRYLDDRLTDEDKAYIRTRYQNTGRYVNHLLRRLFEGWSRLRPNRSRLTVLVSDHGEEFWEHGDNRQDPLYFERGVQHGHTMFNEQILVPLVFHWPEGGLGPRRVARLVSMVDLKPTLETLLAVRPSAAGGVGEPLVADLAGPAEERADDRIVFAESILWGRERKAAISRTHKLVRCAETGEESLFAWGEGDPGEQTDLADDPGAAEVRQRLASALDAWNASTEPAAPAAGYSAGEEAEIEARLRDLGYM